MRIANLENRAVLFLPDSTAIDIAHASDNRFGPGLPALYENWGEFREWAESLDLSVGGEVIDPARLGAPSPEPRQVLAIGLNYSEHAAESGFALPDLLPPVFTKFRTSISGPVTEVTLPPGGNTDWEVELVVVIGVAASRVPVDRAWDHVAGYTVGQDLSERISQLAGPAPQFGLAKSFAGFAPTGPWLVTIDEFAHPDDLELGCRLDDEVVQLGRTRDLLFSVPELIARLSQVITLLPGDIIFTGTPAGVGMGRTPPRYIQAGQTLTTWIEGIGELRQTFKAAAPVT